MIVSDSVCRTASDALMAKRKAVVTAGYQPIPQNAKLYRELLMEMTTTTTTTTTTATKDLLAVDKPKHQQQRRQQQQFPLVSAGYAMRIASIAQTIHSFVSFHNSSSSTKKKTTINIVLMGCGLDVIGLWSKSLLLLQDTTTKTSNDIQIWEVDTLPVTIAKRNKLLEKKLVLEEEGNEDKEKEGIVLEGRIIKSTPSSLSSSSSSMENQDENNNNNNNNYHLIATDLRDLESLDKTLGQAFHDAHNNSNGSREEECHCDDNDTTTTAATATLVVFELVLAYLERDATNNLLEWCTTNLLLNNSSNNPNNSNNGSGSALVAFEPLGRRGGGGPNDDTIASSSNSASTVLEAYQQEYTKQFQAKLKRGQATTTTSDNNNNNNMIFQPFGSSCDQVEQRIQGLVGFGKVHACLAGTAAAHCNNINRRLQQQQHQQQQPMDVVDLSLPQEELFDEHAALTLHLSSYALVVCFPSSSSSSSSSSTTNNDTVASSDNNNTSQEQFELCQRLCPWYYKTGWTKRLDVDVSSSSSSSSSSCSNKNTTTTTTTSTPNNTYYLTPIESQDEAAIREIFEATYKDLAHTHSAVKKMIKTALKNEFASSAPPSSSSTSTTDSSRTTNTNKSAIRLSYQRSRGVEVGACGGGGDFWVAVQYPGRQVLGGIGIKRWKEKQQQQEHVEKQPPLATTTTTTYEIHRFFVTQNYQRQGIGSALLQMIESWIKSKEGIRRRRRTSNNKNFPYRIVATTLALLEEANTFYTKHGYILDKEEMIGEGLQTRTYVKDYFSCA